MVYTDPIIYFATRLATALIGTGGFFAEPTFCVAGGGGRGDLYIRYIQREAPAGLTLPRGAEGQPNGAILTSMLV